MHEAKHTEKIDFEIAYAFSWCNMVMYPHEDETEN